MKEGRTLQNLAVEVDRQQKTRKDYLASEATLQMNYTPAELIRMAVADYDFGVNELAHQQIVSRLDIPQKYYDKMLGEYPQLLTQNVNGWFSRSGNQRLVPARPGSVAFRLRAGARRGRKEDER